MAEVKGIRLFNIVSTDAFKDAPDFTYALIDSTWWIKIPIDGVIGLGREHQVRTNADGSITCTNRPIRTEHWYGNVVMGIFKELG